MITAENIQSRIAQAIRESELSQSEIARRIGVRQPTIAQYISGKTKPNIETVARLCKTLDLDPAYILCLTENE